MTVTHSDNRGAVRVTGDLPAADLDALRRTIAEHLALPRSAGTEAVVLDMREAGVCDPGLRDELLRVLLICADHDAGLRIVPGDSVRRVLGDP
ncbi:hypothetical protein [Pseudonocardia humida]|uniref:STAS domain-containing protein n=1 Tax=Pseudonocardia humida TaxID=2800819 RepID=A0ABT0ZVW2_9PSEU|nr:hypothetical protein [Pseudonocardia humida]MCO1654880.1 hypothetical protein [Pseudonocardia humida]